MLTIIIGITLTLTLLSVLQTKNLFDYVAEQDKNIELLNRIVNQNKKIYVKQLEEVNSLKSTLSSLKSKISRSHDELNEKVTKLYERWDIVADERITSIPKTNKDWWDAKEIVNQPITKIWKPKGLSQSKDSIVGKHNSYVEEELEINQDFANIDDSLLDDILDDEDEADSSSSSSSTQIQKPKPKKKTTQRKM